jgi:Uncharacterized conserved protein
MFKKKLLEDYKDALRTRNHLKRGIVQVLRAAITFEEKYKKLEDEDIFLIIKKEIKIRKDVLPYYEKNYDKFYSFTLQLEMDILNSYLPEKMTENQINRLIDETLKNLKLNDIKDMRKVIISVLNKSKGQADIKMISDLVRKRLEKNNDVVN